MQAVQSDSTRIAHLEKIAYGAMAGIKVGLYLLGVIGIMLLIALSSAAYLYRKDSAQMQDMYRQLTTTASQFHNHVGDPRDHVNSTSAVAALDIRQDLTDARLKRIEDHYEEMSDKMDDALLILRTNHPDGT